MLNSTEVKKQQQ